MIAKFDEMLQLVKLKTVGFDGRLPRSSDQGRVDIKTILQRNRKILENKKLMQLKVIKARRLKIRVGQVLNFTKKQGRTDYRNVSGGSTSSKTSKMQKQRSFSIFTKDASNHGIAKQADTVNKNTDRLKQSHIRILSSGGGLNLQKGPMNLFQNFTEQQLGLIEENPGYYLMKQQYLQLFRKFMFRKRLNKKDKSYETFILKNKPEESKGRGSPSSGNSLKHIMAALGYSHSVEKIDNKFHLLTNPITNDTEKTERSVLPKSLMQSKKALFSQLESRQAMNKQKLDRLAYKKKVDLKISMNYALGLAAQKKAMVSDEKIKVIRERNCMDDQKSFHCRERIKTVNEEFGDSVVIVEQMRSEIIRKRSRKQSMRR